MRIAAFVPDLMDRSRVSAALPEATFVGRPDALAGAGLGPGDVALVDLGRAGALDALPSISATGARVVAFGAHVERDSLDAARVAGADVVLRRSVFFRDVAAAVAPAQE